LAPLLAEADIAIVNGATTMFESLALGVPTIAIPRNPYEKLQAEICAEAGAALMCLPGQIKPGILEQISRIMSEKGLRGDLSANGRRLIDGKGLSRVGEIVAAVLSKRTV
jgi:spore coat polysaccharide biosynthesis predicted glycosyltransferase SpsG